MTKKAETNNDSNDIIPRLFIRQYGPKVKVRIFFSKQGRTKQSFKDECDINTIMARYQQTGQLPDLLTKNNGQYLDVTGYDYQEAMQLVAGAHSLFAELPSHVRLRFENDPSQFLAFTSDPKNREEMARLGLLRADYKPAEPPASTPAEKPAEAPKPPAA